MSGATMTPDRDIRQSRRRRIFPALVKLVLTLAVLYFLYQQIASHWLEIKDHQWRLDWRSAAMSVVVGLAVFFVFSSIWRIIIGGFGHRLGWFRAFRIFYLSNLGRYIPGKVWQLFGILYLAKKEGIAPEEAGASFFLAQLFAIPASFVVYFVAAQFEPALLTDRVAFLGTASAWVITGGMLMLCLLVVLFPNRLVRCTNILLRKLKRPTIAFGLDKKVALGVFLGYSVGWVLYGVAFWCFVEAVAPGTNLNLVAAAGAFSAAYQIGYLALFAPGGFGPREVIMSVLLTPYLGPLAPAVAILARLWAIVVEGLAALMALAVGRLDRRE